MPRISNPEIAAALRRRFEISGEGVIETLSPEIVPVVIADDLGRIESISRPATAAEKVAALAANYARFTISNPVDSGVSLLLKKVFMRADATPRVRGVFGAAITLANGVGVFWRDRRLQGSPAAVVTYDQVGALVGTPAFLWRLEATRPFDYAPLDVILPPNTSLTFTEESVNINLDFTIYWSERDLIQKER